MAVGAAHRDVAAVARDLGADGLLRAAEGPRGPGSPLPPDMHGALFVRGDAAAAVVEADGDDLAAVVVERLLGLAVRAVPQDGLAVGAAAQERAPVRTEREGEHGTAVAAQHPKGLAACRRPQADRAVRPRRRHGAAVGGRDDGVHGAAVPAEVAQLGARRRIPHADRAVVAAAQHEAVVAGHRGGVQAAPAAGQAGALHARLQIEDADRVVGKDDGEELAVLAQGDRLDGPRRIAHRKVRPHRLPDLILDGIDRAVRLRAHDEVPLRGRGRSTQRQREHKERNQQRQAFHSSPPGGAALGRRRICHSRTSRPASAASPGCAEGSILKTMLRPLLLAR